MTEAFYDPEVSYIYEFMTWAINYKQTNGSFKKENAD